VCRGKPAGPHYRCTVKLACYEAACSFADAVNGGEEWDAAWKRLRMIRWARTQDGGSWGENDVRYLRTTALNLHELVRAMGNIPEGLHRDLQTLLERIASWIDSDLARHPTPGTDAHRRRRQAHDQLTRDLKAALLDFTIRIGRRG